MINLISEKGREVLAAYQDDVLRKFAGEKLIGVEMGVAYGGGIEALASFWKGRGVVYGYDTFVGHPIYITANQDAPEAAGMRYIEKQYGKEMLSLAYIQKQLDDQDLDNVHLIQGLVHPESCADLPKIHYALLDMCMIESMSVGFEAVKDKVVEGGYLCIVFTPSLVPWLEGIKADPRWKATDFPEGSLCILERVKPELDSPESIKRKKKF